MPDAREYEGNFISAVDRAATVQPTVISQCGAHYNECAAAPSVEIPCEPISSALMATMARTLRHSPEPLRTCPTLACMAFSLASWDAAMARSIRYRTRSSSKCQVLTFQVQAYGFTSVSSLRSTSTSLQLLFRDRISSTSLLQA